MKIKKSIVIQKLGDVYVAYDNETSTLHELNEVGYLIISELGKGKSKVHILKTIVKEFGVTKNNAEKDFEGFVQELRKKDLIVGKK